MQTSLLCRLQGEHLNGKKDTGFLPNGLKCWYLAIHTAHALVQSPKPICTNTPPKQLSHPLRRSNCSNLRRFETLGHHLELHTCACATKGFVFCHSLPSAPGLGNSKAPEPFSTPVGQAAHRSGKGKNMTT